MSLFHGIGRNAVKCLLKIPRTAMFRIAQTRHDGEQPLHQPAACAVFIPVHLGGRITRKQAPPSLLLTISRRPPASSTSSPTMASPSPCRSEEHTSELQSRGHL